MLRLEPSDGQKRPVGLYYVASFDMLEGANIRPDH